MDKKTIRVYDTITKKYVEIEVSEEFLKEYNRSQWSIENNDASFFEHEIQFSMLIGGSNNKFEKFHEFMTDKDVTERTAAYQMMYKRLHECINVLSKSEQQLITMIFFERKTEKECAEILHTTQQNIHKKKNRILCKLNKLL